MKRGKNFSDRALDAMVGRTYGMFREAPILLVIIVGAAGYWGWKQSQHLDHICYNLFAAFDDTAKGGGYEFTLDFETTVNLLERMPTLRSAARRCHQVRDFMAAYDVLDGQ
jgi:hypothetical protein